MTKLEALSLLSIIAKAQISNYKHDLRTLLREGGDSDNEILSNINVVVAEWVDIATLQRSTEANFNERLYSRGLIDALCKSQSGIQILEDKGLSPKDIFEVIYDQH